MRSHLFGLILVAGIAMPVLAQPRDPVERRVDRIEQELRAVQRRVFPNGRAQFVEPEIRPAQSAAPAPAPAGDALSGFADRVNALESQLRSLTGQIEEQGFRNRQLEEQVTRLRAELQGRLDRLEQPVREAAAGSEPASAAPDAPAATPDEPAAARDEPAAARDEPAAVPASAATAEEAYNEGFRLWDARQYGEAQRMLAAAAGRFPDSRWTSWMRNLQGRAYLDDNKPATAARIFLANYQENPSGERAADSLFYLGDALSRLDRRPEACRVYDELEQVYPAVRDYIRQRLPQARTDARCSRTASSR
jgi:TolA-binding protein